MKDFIWGVSSSAYQTEGAHDVDGKGASIWDVFTAKKGNIFKNENANKATEFYNFYKTDIDIIHELNIPNFRFSIAWSRIFPGGKGFINQKGIDFYHKLIDYCLEKNISPWITCYHWDLPYALETKGGWTNRDTVNYFIDYVYKITNEYGDRVKHWMALNEPMVFTGAGYFLGVHAPGKKGMKNFLPAIHHAALAQASGIKVIKNHVKKGFAGTTFSCSHIDAYDLTEKNILAAKRADALINRMFPELLLGYGYPLHDLPFLKRMEDYFIAGDEKLLKEIPDFIGIQNYTREVVKYNWLAPYLNVKIIPAVKRKVQITQMQWEIYPSSIYQTLLKFAQYPEVKNIIVTENGAAFKDHLHNGIINDDNRVSYLKSYIEEVFKARNASEKIKGYFVWSITDNFEWAEGYFPKFGLVHVNLNNYHRTVKKSAFWYSSFIQREMYRNSKEYL